MTAADAPSAMARAATEDPRPGNLRAVVEARGALGAEVRERARAGGHDVGPCSWHDAPDHAVASGRCRRCRLMCFVTVREEAMFWWGAALEMLCLP